MKKPFELLLLSLFKVFTLFTVISMFPELATLETGKPKICAGIPLRPLVQHPLESEQVPGRPDGGMRGQRRRDLDAHRASVRKARIGLRGLVQNRG